MVGPDDVTMGTALGRDDEFVGVGVDGVGQVVYTVVGDRSGRKSGSLGCDVVWEIPGCDVEYVTIFKEVGVTDGTSVGTADGMEIGG